MRKTIRRSTMYKKKSNTSKRRMSKKIYRKRHSRKHNNLRGGNFGGNCPDPNFSIYNTNLFKLFPYSTFGKG